MKERALRQLVFELIWKRVAQVYMESFARVRSDRMETPRVQFSARATPKAPDQLPQLKLDRVNVLTDDTGVLQHAIFTIPNRAEGYAITANAVVCSRLRNERTRSA